MKLLDVFHQYIRLTLDVLLELLSGAAFVMCLKRAYNIPVRLHQNRISLRILQILQPVPVKLLPQLRQGLGRIFNS